MFAKHRKGVLGQQAPQICLAAPTRLRNLTLLCASSLTVMAGTPIAPALPNMAAAFETHPSSELLVRLMLTMPGLFIGLLAPASGWLIDRMGRKPLLLWGAVLYAAAGSTGLYLDSLWGILAGRALLGVAVSAVMTAAVTLIGDYFTHTARHRFLGLQAAFMSSGGVVFLLAGGILSDLSWRGPFGIYLVAIAVVPMVVVSISEPERSPPAAGSEETAPPAHPPRGTIATIYAVAFLGMIAFYAVPVQLPFHLQQLTGANGTEVGIAIACVTLFGTITSMLYARIKARLSYPAVVAVMLFGLAVGFGMVAVAASYTMILGALTISGLALGLLLPNLNVWLITVAPEASRGRLVGGLTTALFLGQFVSPIALRPIRASWGTGGTFLALSVFLALAMIGFAAYAGYRAWQRGEPATASRDTASAEPSNAGSKPPR